MTSSPQSVQGCTGQLKAVFPVYPASFLFAYEALVKVLFGRKLASTSAADQEMSLVSETKVVPRRQLAGRNLHWIVSSCTPGWLSSPLHHGSHLPVTVLYISLCFSVPSQLQPRLPLSPRVLVLQAQSPPAFLQCLRRQCFCSNHKKPPHNSIHFLELLLRPLLPHLEHF